MTKNLQNKVSSYKSGDCTIDDVFETYKNERIKFSKRASDYSIDTFNKDNKFTLDYYIENEDHFDKFIKKTFSFDAGCAYRWLFWKSEIMDKIRFIATNEKTYYKIKNKFRFKYNTKPLNIIS